MSFMTGNVLRTQPSADNPNLRKYHTRLRELGDNWLTKLALLPGIIEVRTEPYILWVYKARLFAWEEIETGISPILEAAHEQLIIDGDVYHAQVKP